MRSDSFKNKIYYKLQTTHLQIYIYIVLSGPVKPELGVIPSGQKKKKKKHSTVNI